MKGEGIRLATQQMLSWTASVEVHFSGLTHH